MGTPRSGDGGIHYSTVVKTTAGRPLTMGRQRVTSATELLTAP